LTGNTTFKLPGHTDAEAVAIHGSFNNWIQTKNHCTKEVDAWVCRLDLAPGKYTYKFLIGGVGLNDPINPDILIGNRHQAKIKVAAYLLIIYASEIVIVGSVIK
jgi:hypothetical protein